MQKIISQIIAGYFLLERGHQALYKLSPQYASFCDKTKTKVLRKLKIKPTAKDAICDHVQSDELETENAHVGKGRTFSAYWFINNHLNIEKIVSLDGIAQDTSRQKTEEILGLHVRTIMDISEYDSLGYVPFWLVEDKESFLTSTDQENPRMNIFYEGCTILGSDKNGIKIAIVIRKHSLTVCRAKKAKSVFRNELTSFLAEGAYDYRGLLLMTNHPTLDTGIETDSFWTREDLTKQFRAKSNRDMTLYSRSIREHFVQDIFSFIEKQDEFKPDKNRRYLLSGPPGTGKSTLISKIIGMLPYDFTPVICYPGYLKVLQESDIPYSLPCFVVIEDIDLLISRPEELQQLLQYLDGLDTGTKRIVVMTTNHPKNLPDSLLARPGRIDKIIEVGLPDPEARIRQIEDIFEGYDLTISHEEMSELTKEYNIAHYRELLRRARLYSESKKLNNIRLAIDEMTLDIETRKKYRN